MPFVEPETGIMTLPWYRFIAGLPAGLISGTGAPPNTFGSDGNFYFRLDGAVGSNIYKRTAGVWAAIL